MKHWLLVLACIAAHVHIAQTTLSGVVRNKSSKEPLPGAVIYFPDLKTGTVSNADGKYSIAKLPRVKTLMQVKMLGFKSLAVPVDLALAANYDIELEESAVEADEVVVTGTSHSTELRRSPVPMALIDQKYLSQVASSNIVEAMSKIPGISALSSGPNIAKPYIRGLGYNRVLTLFDGVRQDGQQWGDEHGVEIDQFLVDRVEVVKGPASLVYGSDALAGVVNMLPANPAPEGTLRGSALVAYHTNNNQVAGSLALAGNNGGFVWSARASAKQAAAYRNAYDGRVFGTKYAERNANLLAGINKGWGYSHLNFSLYDNRQEVPDGSRDSLSRKFVKQVTEADTVRPIVSDEELASYAIGVVHQHVQHFRLYSDNNLIFGKSKLGVKLGWQQSRRREYGHPEYPALPGLALRLSTASYDVKYYLPERKGWQGTMGLNGMYQVNRNSDATEFVIPDYRSTDLGPFLFVKKTFGRLDLASGLRYDLRFFENDALYTKTSNVTGFDAQVPADASDSTIVKQFDAYSHTFSGLSGSMGATYNKSEKICFKANVSRGYRAPNIAEIAAKGVHPGTGFQQLGDVNFKPEFNLQEDLGLFFSTNHLTGSVEIFHNLITNYIYNEKLLSALGGDSIYTEAGNAYQVFKFRQTRAQLYGAEFSFDIHPHPLDWLHFENTASLILASNLGGSGALITDSTRYLPFIPPFHTNSELRADLKKKVLCFSEIFIKMGLQYYAAQKRVYSAYGTETETPGYALLDAGAGASVNSKKGKTLFTFSILASNLTDLAYQSNMSRLKYFDNYPGNYTGRSGIYNMGRNIVFRIVVPVNVQLKKQAE
jgi:iron complex outermembrane recepter protein